MKSVLLFPALLVMSMTVFCQHKIDSALQRQIKLMFKEDQKWRIESDHLNRGKKSEYDEATVIKLWQRLIA